jgi:hypothetical protein
MKRASTDIRRFRRLCALAFLISAGLSSSAIAQREIGQRPSDNPQRVKPPISDGHQHDLVNVKCGAGIGHVCNFAILRAKGGVLPVKVEAGKTTTVEDLEIGKDYFLAKLDAAPPLSLAVCRAQRMDFPPCHWGILTGVINESGNPGGLTAETPATP